MSGPGKARILVVEDEAVVAIDIQTHLEMLGYSVVATAATGEDACARAAALGPDLVLMDIRLGGAMDGVEAGNLIRERQDIPVVFLTAHADRPTLERAKAAAPYGYVLKPFEEQDLQVTIELALSQHAMERQLRESRRDLRVLLDAQRNGTVLLDEGGRLTFLNRAALEMLGVGGNEASGQPWREALGLPPTAADRLGRLLDAPALGREKTRLETAPAGGAPRVLEVEAIDDPRSAGQRILFLYDVSELHELRQLVEKEASFQGIIGRSGAMQEVFQLVRDLARVDTSVLIEGQTGTGKELVARAIHDLGARCDGPFVPVNCGALSETLASSQLFGHRRGSFTGAIADSLGLFQAADGGTLFLDEVAELPKNVQTLLLRALEEGSVARVGDERPRDVDVRVIAATNRSLEEEVEADRFRTDLFYRIRVARIRLPALRERRPDLPLLAQAFLARARATTGKPIETLDREAMNLLLDYSWPGNVRELKNVLEFAAIRARGAVVGPGDLPPEVRDGSAPAAAGEEGRIRAALARAGGNRKEAARMLGVSRATLYRRLEQYGIE